MNSFPNRAARRAKGYRQQVKPVKINVPRTRAEQKGVKQGDRFVIPGKKLGTNGQLELCEVGEETLFLANIVDNPTEEPCDSLPAIKSTPPTIV